MGNPGSGLLIKTQEFDVDNMISFLPCAQGWKWLRFTGWAVVGKIFF